MFSFQSSVSASIALVLSTIALAACAGPVVAYMAWANDRGIHALKRWLLWIASMVVVLIWAQVVGTAMDTPGVNSIYALIALGAGVLVFCLGYLLRRRSLPARDK